MKNLETENVSDQTQKENPSAMEASQPNSIINSLAEVALNKQGTKKIVKPNRKKTAEKNKISLLKNAEFYLGLHEKDHYLLWFSKHEILQNLIDKMSNYIRNNENSDPARCQDFARFFKLSKHSVVVFYQKNMPFNSVELNKFFEEEIEAQPFVEIYQNLQREAEMRQAYLSSFTYRKAELADGNSYFAKLVQYYNWKNGEILQYIENITANETSLIQEILNGNEPTAKKQKHKPKTRERKVIESAIAFLQQGICYKSFQEEKDHLVILFNDNKVAKQFEGLNARFKKKNSQETSYIKDLMRFCRVGDDVLIVFYQKDIPFNAEELNIHFNDVAIEPSYQVLKDLKAKFLSAKWSLIASKNPKQNHTPEKKEYVTKLCQYYHSVGYDEEYWGEFFKFMKKVENQHLESQIANILTTELSFISSQNSSLINSSSTSTLENDLSENTLAETRPKKRARIKKSKNKNEEFENKMIDCLVQGKCYKCFKEEKDHLVLWFEDEQALKKFGRLNKPHLDKNLEQTTRIQDLPRFIKVGTHILFVFYQTDKPFNSKKLNEHFSKITIHPEDDEILTKLETQISGPAKESVIMLMSTPAKTGKTQYLPRLWQYYAPPMKHSNGGEFFKYIESKTATVETSLPKTSFLNSPSWRESLLAGANRQFEQDRSANLGDNIEENSPEINLGKEEESDNDAETSQQSVPEIHYLSF